MSIPTPIARALSALAIVAFNATLIAAQVPLRSRTNIARQLQLAAEAPTGLQIAQSGPAVVVSWSPTAGEASYRVYRAPDQASFTELTPGPIPATTFPDTTAAAGSTYYYRVAAEYPDGRVGMSDPMAFTVPALTTQLAPLVKGDIARRAVVIPPGPPPTNLAAVPAPTSVALSWPALLNVNGYRIERSVPAGSGQWAPVGTAPAPAFTDTGLDPDLPVQYRVTAEYADGRQGTSNPISTRTTKPVNPAHLRATVATHVINAQITPTWNASSVASGDITLAWDPVPGAGYYEISGTHLSIAKTVPATTYTIPDAPPGQAQYQVVAYFLNGVRRYGDAANPAKVEVLVGPPPVTGFKGYVIVEAHDRVDFQWLDPSGTARFKLLRADAEQGPYSEVPTVGSLGPTGGSDANPHVQGKSYYYKLFSIFPSGPVASTAPLRIDIPAPVVIANATATSPAPHTVKLSWAPVPGAVEFSILRGRGLESMDWIQWYGTTMKLMGSATGYTDSGVYSGYTYRYSVCVKTNNGGSACTGTLSVAVQ